MGQAAEENSIHYAENRRCCANSHRECGNYRNGKDRIAPECSQCVPDIPSKSFQECHATHLPTFLFDSIKSKRNVGRCVECHATHLPTFLFDLIESTEFKTKAPD